MFNERKAVLLWASQGSLAPDRVEEAMRLAGALPDRNSWLRFIDRLLLWSGTALVAAGVIFFIAFNWTLLGHFVHFALVEVLIIAAVAIGAWLGLDQLGGKAALFAAAIFLGALLALLGQTYQTGADTYELFAVWAVLIFPWAII